MRRPDDDEAPLAVPPAPIDPRTGLPREWFTKTETHTLLGIGRDKFEGMLREMPYHLFARTLLNARSTKGSASNSPAQYPWAAIQRVNALRAGGPWPWPAAATGTATGTSRNARRLRPTNGQRQGSKVR
jgi:hypothetical protein